MAGAGVLHVVTESGLGPVLTGLTPHGLRHGHQTWLDDLGIRYVLQSERTGREVPGMRGVYSHITQRMRDELTSGLQELWLVPDAARPPRADRPGGASSVGGSASARSGC